MRGVLPDTRPPVENDAPFEAPRRSFLAIYLRDHHAASQAGMRLARRVSRRDPARGAIGEEVREDADALRHAMARLGVNRGRVKDGIAIGAERLGRLKPNGRALRRSPLSDLVELETLVVGITAKRALWTSLRDVGAVPPDELDRLLARADDQLGRVEAARRRAATRALARTG